MSKTAFSLSVFHDIFPSKNSYMPFSKNHRPTRYFKLAARGIEFWSTFSVCRKLAGVNKQNKQIDTQTNIYFSLLVITGGGSASACMLLLMVFVANFPSTHINPIIFLNY